MDVNLAVPDAAGPGPWQDASGLGPDPLAQLSAGAKDTDLVRFETSPDNTGNTGIVASTDPLEGTVPVVVDKPISWVRAVRIIEDPAVPVTTGLQVVLRSTNAGSARSPSGATLIVPDAPAPTAVEQAVPGLWVDASMLGPQPLAQLSAGATLNDQVRIETCSDNAGNAGIVASSDPLAGSTPVVVDAPVSWMRAVRIVPPRSAPQTPGLTVLCRSTNVGGQSGSGAWAGWGAQADVYVSPSGSPENSGLDAAHPITFEAYADRLGSQAVTAPGSIQTVHVAPGSYTAQVPGQPIPVVSPVIGNGYTSYVGTVTPVAGQSSRITATVLWDGPTHRIGIYTTAAPALDFATYDSLNGYMVEVVGGPRDGMLCPIGISPAPGVCESPGGADPASPGSPAQPQVGDAIRIVQLPIVGAGAVVTIKEPLHASLCVGAPPAAQHSIMASAATVAFPGFQGTGCIFLGLDMMPGSVGYFGGCCVAFADVYGTVFEAVATLWRISCQLRTGGYVEAGPQSLWEDEGPKLGGHQGPGVLHIIGSAAVSRYASGVQVLEAGSALVIKSDFWLDEALGGGAGVVGFQIGSRCCVVYNAGLKPAVVNTAPATYALVGGTPQAAGGIPFAETVNATLANFAVNQ